MVCLHGAQLFQADPEPAQRYLLRIYGFVFSYREHFVLLLLCCPNTLLQVFFRKYNEQLFSKREDGGSVTGSGGMQDGAEAAVAARDGHDRDERPCRGEHPSRSKHPRTVGLHIMHRSVRAPQAAAGAEPCKTTAFRCTSPWSNPALSQPAVEMARGGNGRTWTALVPCG